LETAGDDRDKTFITQPGASNVGNKIEAA